MKPIFVINTLSETVAKKGSKLAEFESHANAIFDKDIFDKLDQIVTGGADAGWVIIESGDGTAQAILSAFLNQLKDISRLPKFTLLPGGMTNQVAKNIGLKTLSSSSVAKLLSGAKTELQTPLLKISSDGLATSYGFLLSTGGVPMITEYTKDKLHSKGIGGSAAVVGGILRGVSGRANDVLYPTDITLEIDGQDALSGSHLGTLVTTLPSLILGLDPFWGEGDKPLRVTAVAANPKKLAGHAAGLWLGRKSKDRSADGLQSWTAERLDYRYHGPIVLDGETLPEGLAQGFTVTPTQPVVFVK